MFHFHKITNGLDDWNNFVSIPNVDRYVRHALTQLNKVPSNCIRPSPERIFRMFRLMKPQQISVVIFGENPFPGNCPHTGIEYAYGIAFYCNPKSQTYPKALDVLFPHTFSKSPRNDIINLWMSQGVFLTNAALSIGTNCPKHLVDHGAI